MNELISIIVPVYNVEKYIRRCLDSLLCQSYKNLEIILIDDGSPDGCGVICDEYAQKDARVKVIHKENGGVSAARNDGLEMATGNYIGFVDPDDYISTEMYEFLYAQITEGNYDIVQCNFSQVDSAGIIARNLDHIMEQVLLDREHITKAFFKNDIRYSVWNKLFRCNVTKNVRFVEDLRIGEDKLFVYDCLNNANRVKITSKYCYYYISSDSSVIHSKITEKKFDDIRVLDILYNRNKSDEKVMELYKNHAAKVIFSVVFSTLLSCEFKDRIPEMIVRVLELKNTILKGNFSKSEKIFTLMLSVAPKMTCRLTALYLNRKRRTDK